jgi:hypothetical protein
MEKQATHFMEVWKVKQLGIVNISPPKLIGNIKTSLSVSEGLGCTTIAIFKIYPKNK